MPAQLPHVTPTPASRIVAALAAAATLSPSLQAQDCTGAPARATLGTQEPFVTTYYADNVALIDLDVSTPMRIHGFDTLLYDQGAGNPPTPDQLGLTAEVHIYICNGSALGNSAALPPFPPHHRLAPGGTFGAPWRHVATGSVLVEAFPGTSHVHLGGPLHLTPGRHGIALEFVPPDPNSPANIGHPNVGNAGELHLIIGGGGPNQTLLLSVLDSAVQDRDWVGAPSPNGAVNVRIDYEVGSRTAWWQPFGAGCYDRPHAFYDELATGTAWQTDLDLYPTSSPVGPRYLVTPGSASYVVPGSDPTTSLHHLTQSAWSCSTSASWDDAAATFTMPFSIAPPGAPASDQISIGSNGWVQFGSQPLDCAAFYGNFARLQDQNALIAAFFGDLDPTAGGQFTYEVHQNGDFVRATWHQVSEWQTTTTQSFQVTVHSSGNIQLAYDTMNPAAITAVIGYSPGSDAALPPEVDLTQLPFEGGDGGVPPTLFATARPVTGGPAPNLVTTDLHPTAVLGATLLSLGSIPGGLDLGNIGAPGCAQWVGNPAVSLGLATPQNGQFSVPFPTSLLTPAAIGAPVVVQSAVLDGTQVNNVGGLALVVSNAACLIPGDDADPLTPDDLLLFDPSANFETLTQPAPGQPIALEVFDLGPFNAGHTITFSTDDPSVTVTPPTTTMNFGGVSNQTIQLQAPNLNSIRSVQLQARIQGPNLNGIVRKQVTIAPPPPGPACRVLKTENGRSKRLRVSQFVLEEKAGRFWSSSIGATGTPGELRQLIIVSGFGRHGVRRIEYRCDGNGTCSPPTTCQGTSSVVQAGRWQLVCGCR
ncbi:MAG: hypothetical protein NXI31_18980 [bacterium]|nr:hypothetical protein [bacterium]